MDFDLIVRNATLVDGRKGQSIACKDGRIVAIGPIPEVQAEVELDAGGRLVSPPFVDIHFHLDTALTLGSPRFNESGTLLEGIAILGEMMPLLDRASVMERARRYCHQAIAQGLLAIRSHVNVSDSRLIGLEALLELREEMRPYLDLQFVAFPQDGYLRSAVSAPTLDRALDMGVEVVGGIPHLERTTAEGDRSVTMLCEIAARRGLMVDLHCDENDDPASRHIEVLTAETRRLGLEGKVTGSHLTSMHSMDNGYVSKLLALMAEARVHAVANPLANMVLQGRADGFPKRRGITRISALKAAGVNVAFGHDSAMDPFYPFGSADMLEVANMGVHAAHLTGRQEIAFCFQAVTENAARIFGLEGYGVKSGCNADFVLLDASDPIEAVRLRAARLAVVRRGKVIAVSPGRKARLDLGGRQHEVEFRAPEIRPVSGPGN